jgi:hypothetical protein
MISDIISQLVLDLDHYLTDPDIDDTYSGETRDGIIRLRDEADNLRSALDKPSVVIPAADDNPDGPRSARSEWIAWMMSDASAAISPIFSQKDLLGRGWSKRLIAELLGEPDSTCPNPHGVGFASMRCWRQDRVLLAEETPAFRPSRRKSRNKGVPVSE